jgi:hypothetical protein
MLDILRLMLGDGDGKKAQSDAGDWDEPRRRPSVADSRDWCGSEPGGDAIRRAVGPLRSRGRHVVVRGGRRAGPFGR